MISYRPFINLCTQLGITNMRKFFEEVGVNHKVSTRMMKGKSINLSSLDKLANYIVENYGLELSIEDLIEYIPGDWEA